MLQFKDDNGLILNSYGLSVNGEDVRVKAEPGPTPDIRFARFTYDERDFILKSVWPVGEHGYRSLDQRQFFLLDGDGAELTPCDQLGFVIA